MENDRSRSGKRKFLEDEEEMDANKAKGIWLKIVPKKNYKGSINRKIKEDKHNNPPKESVQETKFMIVPVGRNFEDEKTLHQKIA